MEGELVDWISPGVAMREAVVTDPQKGDLVPPSHDFKHGGIGSGVARSPHHREGAPFVAVMLRAKDGTHYPAMITSAIAPPRSQSRRLFGPAPAIRELHPSAATLDAVRALRDLHFANGHTPEHDAIEHGPAFFTTAAREFLQRAEHARSPVKQRRRRIAAIAMLVALVDRAGFLSAHTQQPASNSPLAVGQQGEHDVS